MQPAQQGARRQNTFTGSPIGLIGVRAVWVMVSVCLLVLITTSLPSAYAHLQVPCRNPTCDVGQNTVDNVIALHRLGLPVAVYALYPFLTSLLTGGILFLVSFVIFWRRSDQWFPFFVSLWLLLCVAVAGIGPTSPLLPAQVMRGIANGLTMLVFCGLGIFCATFPNGRLAPRWSGCIPLLWMLQLLAFFAPGPFNITNWPGPLFPLEVLLVFASTLALQIYRYVLIVGYIGALFQTPNNALISPLATALVAIVFQPLRSLLQRAANRLLYGERDVPYQMLARLD